MSQYQHSIMRGQWPHGWHTGLQPGFEPLLDRVRLIRVQIVTKTKNYVLSQCLSGSTKVYKRVLVNLVLGQ